MKYRKPKGYNNRRVSFQDRTNNNHYTHERSRSKRNYDSNYNTSLNNYAKSHSDSEEYFAEEDPIPTFKTKMNGLQFEAQSHDMSISRSADKLRSNSHKYRLGNTISTRFETDRHSGQKTSQTQGKTQWRASDLDQDHQSPFESAQKNRISERSPVSPLLISKASEEDLEYRSPRFANTQRDTKSGLVGFESERVNLFKFTPDKPTTKVKRKVRYTSGSKYNYRSRSNSNSVSKEREFPKRNTINTHDPSFAPNFSREVVGQRIEELAHTAQESSDRLRDLLKSSFKVDDFDETDEKCFNPIHPKDYQNPFFSADEENSSFQEVPVRKKIMRKNSRRSKLFCLIL